jgi:hypothetical protein
MARTHLDVDAKIQKCYDGKMDGKYDWLVISDEKILFIQEKGLLSKKISLIHDFSRDNIKEIKQEGTHEMISQTSRVTPSDSRPSIFVQI